MSLSNHCLLRHQKGNYNTSEEYPLQTSVNKPLIIYTVWSKHSQTLNDQSPSLIKTEKKNSLEKIRQKKVQKNKNCQNRILLFDV